MKKSILLLSFLMIFALVLFTGCDGLFGGSNANNLTTVKSFEVVDDSAVAMTYTEDTDATILRAMIALGVVKSDQTVAQNQIQITLFKEMLNQAKISETQLNSLTTLLEANKDVIAAFKDGGEAAPARPTDAEITAILELYKASITIIGNDAAGKLAYQLTLKSAGSDAEAIASVEAIGYQTFVVSSRMSFAVVNSLIWSVDASDVNLISSLTTKATKPTNAEIVQLLGIAADAFEAIGLEESTWTQFFTLISDKIDQANALVPENPEETPEFTQARAVAVGVVKEYLAILGEYMAFNFKTTSALLKQVDENFVATISINAFDDKWAWDDELGMRITKYYFGEEEVTEEVYKKHEFKIQSLLLGLEVRAEATFSKAEKAKLKAQTESLLGFINTQLEEDAETPFVYTGASSTYDQLNAKMKILAELNYETLTLAQIEAEFEAAEVVLNNYIGSNYPYVFEVMETENNSPA